MKPIQSRIASISLCLTALLLFLQLPFFLSAGFVKASSNVIYHAYVFGWMLALFWKRFTIPLRTAISFLFVGIYPAMFVSVLLSLPFLTIHSFLAFVAVPFIEEAAKLLPVAVYLWYLHRTNRWQPSASDGLFLGWLVGAGFALHEDAMSSIVFGQGWFASRYSPLLPTIGGSGAAFQPGHAMWTAFAGIATAFSLLYWKHRLARAVPILVFALVVLDHIRADAPASILFSVRWLPWMLGDGQVTILLFLSAIAAVFVIEGRLLANVAQSDWLFSEVSLKQSIKPGSLISTIRQTRNVVNYQRLRRATHYRLWQWSGNAVFDRANEMGATLLALAEKIGLPLENKFEEVLTMSIPADRKIYPGGGTDQDGSLVAG
jgi:RsiW-degrading membrane proteinase PrsW (M82 family)